MAVSLVILVHVCFVVFPYASLAQNDDQLVERTNFNGKRKEIETTFTLRLVYAWCLQSTFLTKLQHRSAQFLAK